MAKNNVFKKAVALVAAIMLVVCFAVSASAVNVQTTTTYAGNDVHVDVTVTGVAANSNVTYYATRVIEGVNTPVHIDQTQAEGTTAHFEFNTDAANLMSAVKVGSVDAAAATDSIEGYTVTYNGDGKIVPNGESSYSLTFDYEGTPNYEFKEATAAPAENVTGFSASQDGEYITFTFTAITGDITITSTEEEVPVGTVTAEATALEAAGLVVKAYAGDIEDYEHEIKWDGTIVDGETVWTEDANAEKVNDRKITVIGKVAQATEYGVIVTKDAITEGAISANAFKALEDANKTYAGATIGDDGIFAVQLIDTSDITAPAFIEAGTYNTAIYAKDANGAYVISGVKEAVVE